MILLVHILFEFYSYKFNDKYFVHYFHYLIIMFLYIHKFLLKSDE